MRERKDGRGGTKQDSEGRLEAKQYSKGTSVERQLWASQVRLSVPDIAENADDALNMFCTKRGLLQLYAENDALTLQLGPRIAKWRLSERFEACLS